ncbi:MAG TPA: GNAT family N-acetyltransferase [Pyrinomonadaceae bacterium]|jgi:RimJ/RimL family protein N-acetyltransferase|nr:GNAT family N-acetyltransferase [Pyrinomonadaceae bacterium]
MRRWEATADIKASPRARLSIDGGRTPEKEGASSMNILETERLNLRPLHAGDAAFILELLNDEAFLRNIGDKGVRTMEDAVRYILEGPVASYARHGFGLWLVELKETGTPAGICGLVKRDTLPDADIGYAFLPRFWSQGYAYESAAAVLSYASSALGLGRVLAVTNPDNAGSIKVLEKIGLKFDRLVRLSDDAPEIMLFASEL